MSRLRRPTSLRTRLFLSYAALVLLTVVLASGASLALYAKRLSDNAHHEMVSEAETLANVVAAAGGEEPISALQLAEILYADPRIRERPRPFLIVDAAGAPVVEIWPPPNTWFGRSGRGSATPTAAPGASGAVAAPDVAASAAITGTARTSVMAAAPARDASAARSRVAPPFVEASQPAPIARSARSPSGQPFLRRPRQFTEMRYPPRSADASGQPEIGEVAFPNGPRMLYVTVPLAVTIDRHDTELARLKTVPDPPLFLVVSRFRTEVRGLWQPLVPSIALVGSLALVLASGVAYLLARSITRPLETMTQASERIAGGHYAVRVPAAGASEIDRLASAFNTMAHQVGEAQRRQRDFVVNVSHDLRTPLTTIRGFARALVDGTAHTGAQHRKAVEAIEAASHRMATLVETLIDLARLEGQIGGMQVEAVDAAELLARVVEDHRHAADSAGVGLAVDAPPGLLTRANPGWLARALGNIVDNAIQHSPAATTVRLTASAEAKREEAPGTGILLAIEDHGAGIAPEDLPRVFERFYRGDRARSGQGSGLGLSIAREIVEAHGGALTLHSRPGQGTRVTLRLDAWSPPEPGTGDTARPDAWSSAESDDPGRRRVASRTADLAVSPPSDPAVGLPPNPTAGLEASIVLARAKD